MTALAFRAAALRKLPGLLLIAGLIALHILLDGPLGAFREKSFDAYQQLSPRAESGNPVVLVAIDDLSLKTHGRWPWNRGKLAELVERTAESGAAVVGIDLILAEADTGPEGAAGDARLARALARVPSVVAVSLGHEITSFEAEPKAGWSIVGEVPETLPGFRGLTASLPQFSEAAAGLGVIRSVPDGDGVLRHVPILWLRQGPDRLQLWPSFALELLRLYAGEEGYIARMAGEGFDALRIAGAIVPLEPAGTIRLWESRHDPPRVSAADLLAGRKDARLENAVAIIELSAVGLSQFQLTPTRPARAGGDIHAAAIEQMIAGRYLEAPAMARLFERGWFLIAALIIVGGWGILARRLWVGTFVIALLVLAPLAYGFLAYRLDGELFDPVQPVVGIVLVAAFEGYSLYRRAEERRNTLARQFSQYMSPSVVAQLAESDTAAMLSGEKREITILLSDIRGFTRMSEKLDAQETGVLVNHFLGLATDEILKRDGTIDKFMGDAVLAFWNAPLAQSDHKARALEAAQALIARVKAENADFAAKGHEPISIGVALETGICSVGNFGSEKRFDYTAIGSPVNRTARLESTTKALGVPLVLGPGFAEGAPVEVVQAGAFDLQGFTGKVPVYTLPALLKAKG